MENTNFIQYGVYTETGYIYIRQVEESRKTIDRSLRPGQECYLAYFKDTRDNYYWVAATTPDMANPYGINKADTSRVEKCNRHIRTDYDVMSTRKFLR